MTRHLAFEGIENFRDFGDYAARDGRRMRKGVLYRAAHQSRATEADLQRMAELGLSVIVDLRRSNEREREPSRRWDGFTGEVIENDIGQDTADEWATFIQSSELSVETVRGYMMQYYSHLPFQRRHVDLYRRYFTALAETDGAILVHCAAGKDRTGLICALTHHISGVHDDDIVQDYLLTNNAERMAARLPLMRQMIQEQTGRAPPDDALLAAMRVEAEYLDEAFRVIREAHGSLDGYLDEALGLDADLRARLHDRLLA